MRVGIGVLPGAVSWRVNSAGTHNCRPDGHHALWNFTSGNLPLDRKGNFRGAGSSTPTPSAGTPTTRP